MSAEVGRREALVTAKRWHKSGGKWRPTEHYVEQQLGVVFFERALELLGDGGRMAIVLPETFLFSSSFRWFVEWMCSTVTMTHVIDVPMLAFEEYCRAKTCLLFVRKAAAAAGHRIIMSYPQSIGQDKKGSPCGKWGQRESGTATSTTSCWRRPKRSSVGSIAASRSST